MGFKPRKVNTAAIALYAILERDCLDFMDMLPEYSLGTLGTLYMMLMVINREHSRSTNGLNKIGADIVRDHVRNRFNVTLEPVGAEK